MVGYQKCAITHLPTEWLVPRNVKLLFYQLNGWLPEMWIAFLPTEWIIPRNVHYFMLS